MSAKVAAPKPAAKAVAPVAKPPVDDAEMEFELGPTASQTSIVSGDDLGLAEEPGDGKPKS